MRISSWWAVETPTLTGARRRPSASVAGIFTGSVDIPEDYYAAADLLVLPTRSDPWGIPVIEAMAAGVPVVTTAAAGSASTAERAGAAVIVPARSPERLADAIGELLRDPDRRREMGERGKAEAMRFDVSSVLDATLRVYERALADKSAWPRRVLPGLRVAQGGSWAAHERQQIMIRRRSAATASSSSRAEGTSAGTFGGSSRPEPPLGRAQALQR